MVDRGIFQERERTIWLREGQYKEDTGSFDIVVPGILCGPSHFYAAPKKRP